MQENDEKNKEVLLAVQESAEQQVGTEDRVVPLFVELASAPLQEAVPEEKEAVVAVAEETGNAPRQEAKLAAETVSVITQETELAAEEEPQKVEEASIPTQEAVFAEGQEEPVAEEVNVATQEVALVKEQEEPAVEAVSFSTLDVKPIEGKEEPVAEESAISTLDTSLEVKEEKIVRPKGRPHSKNSVMHTKYAMLMAHKEMLFYQYFGLDAALLLKKKAKGVPAFLTRRIVDTNLSTRATSALDKNNIYTVSSLLKLNYQTLAGFRGMGMKSVVDVLDFLSEQVGAYLSVQQDEDGEEVSSLSEQEKIFAHMDASMEELYLGPFLRIYNWQECDAFPIFCRKTVHVEKTPLKELPSLVEKFSQGKLDMATYMRARAKMNNFIIWLASSNLATVCERVYSEIEGHHAKFSEILLKRSTGMRLEAIAKEKGVSRERIRQLENVGIYRLRHNIENCPYDFCLMLYAYSKGKKALSQEDVRAILGRERADILWYCIGITATREENFFSSHEDYFYEPSTQTIIYFNNKIENAFKVDDKGQSVVRNYVESLPELLERKELTLYLQAFARREGIPYDLVATIAQQMYKRKGIMVYKEMLTLLKMCEYVLKTCFPHGYKIKDTADTKFFLSELQRIFGTDGGLYQRTLEVKIGKVGVLCGRGRYISSDYVNFPQSLCNDIFTAIDEVDSKVVSYSSLFNSMASRLKANGISNRYFLQGVVKYLSTQPQYQRNYVYIRDYIYKDRTVNIEDELTQFVQEKGIASKEELLARFKGWKDYNIAMVAVRCPDLICAGRCCYMHKSIFNLSDEDYQHAEAAILACTVEHPIHIRVLKQYFAKHLPTFCEQYKLDTQGKFFGFLQYIFQHKFFFSRPFIMREEKRGFSQRDLLAVLLKDKEILTVSELVKLSKEHQLYANLLTYILSSVAPEFLRVDADLIMRREKIGITDEVVSQVVEVVERNLKENNGYLPATLVPVTQLPPIAVPWTSFLVESVVQYLTQVKFIRYPSPAKEIANSIFLNETYQTNDWQEFVYQLLSRRKTPLRTRENILAYLRRCGVCGRRAPYILKNPDYFTVDENGWLWTK